MIRSTYKILAMALCVLTSSAAQAQTPPVPAAAQSQKSIPLPKTPTSDDGSDDSTASEIIINDGYVVPTFQNLSKLYWALGMFEADNKDAIDGYLMINECALYKKLYNNDFELEKLRLAARESIGKKLNTFPLKLEVIFPIGLGRYNMGTETFEVDPRSQMNGAKRIEVAVNNDYDEVCTMGAHPVPGYPKNFILSLSRPLNISVIAVNPEMAELYMKKSAAEAPKHRERMEFSDFSRVAYVRMTVTMNQFKGYRKADSQSSLMAEIFGTIDGYELYGDRAKTMLMFNRRIAAERILKKGPAKAVTIPNGQLMQTQSNIDNNVVDQVNGTVSAETGVAAEPVHIPSAQPSPVVPGQNPATQSPVNKNAAPGETAPTFLAPPTAK